MIMYTKNEQLKELKSKNDHKIKQIIPVQFV